MDTGPPFGRPAGEYGVSPLPGDRIPAVDRAKQGSRDSRVGIGVTAAHHCIDDSLFKGRGVE